MDGSHVALPLNGSDISHHLLLPPPQPPSPWLRLSHSIPFDPMPTMTSTSATPSASNERSRPSPPPPSLTSLFASHLTASSASWTHSSQVTLSSTPLPSTSPLLPPPSHPNFIPASTLLNPPRTGVHGTVRPSHSAAPPAPSSDDMRMTDLSDDTEDSQVTTLSLGDDVASHTTRSTAATSLSTASSAVSLSSLSSLLRALGTMSAHDMQMSGILPSSPATDPPSTSSPSPPVPPPHPLPTPSGLREVGDDGVWTLSSCKAGNGVAQLRDGRPDTYWQSDGLAPHYVSVHFARKTRVAQVSFYVDFKLDESYTPSRVVIRGGSHSQAMKELCAFDLDEPTGWINVPTLVPVQRDVAARKPRKAGKKKGGEEEKGDVKAPVITPASFFSASNPLSRLPFAKPPEAEGEAAGAGGVSMVPLRCHYLQLVVLASHQSGKDTHVREMKVYGPVTSGKEGGQRGRGIGEGKENGGSHTFRAPPLHPVFSSIEFQSTSTLR